MTSPTLAEVDQARARLDEDLDELIGYVRALLRAGEDPTSAATAVAQTCVAAGIESGMQIGRFMCLLGCAVVREAQRLEGM